MDELPIGRRVAYWRGRRRMSQQHFADRLGKSKSWVDKMERGVRRLDGLKNIYEIADVLQIDAQLLLGRDPVRMPDSTACIDQVEVEEIRGALERYNQVVFAFSVTAAGQPPDLAAVRRSANRPPDLAEVRKAVNHAWLTFQHSEYGVLARALPRLLHDTQLLEFVTPAGGDEHPETASLLAQTYQIASSTLRKLGEHELSWLAADRAIGAATHSDDPLMTGIATARTACSLLSLGRARPALEMTLNVANRLTAGTAADRTSVHGILLLTATMAAARLGDSATVADLTRAAGEAADQLDGNYNHYWTCFGPANVDLHRVAAFVELGEGGRAVEVHERIDQDGFSQLLPERRAAHFLDAARAYSQVGKVDLAAEMLLAGDRLAPAEIRCRPTAHEVLGDVLRHTRGTPAQPVADLAEQMGVGV